MARLQIQQVQAPDFSAAGNILAQAGASFDRGLASASELLSSYQKGQQETGDKALLAEIAGIKDEDGLASFLGSADLANANLSSEMREHVLGLRDSVIGYAQKRANVEGTRASTAGTRANTSIALATEGRNAYNHQAGIDAKANETALARNYANALATGQTNGVGAQVNPDTRMLLARTLQAEAGNQGLEGMLDVGAVINNRAASGKYGEGIDGVIMRPGQFSAWNSVTGYANGEQGQDMSFEPSAEALAAADALLTGQYEDRTGGATHYYNPDISQPEWGGPQFTRRGAHVFGNADGLGPQDGRAYVSSGSANPPSAAQAALMGAVAQSSELTLDQVDRLFGGMNAASDRGQSQIDTRNAAIVENTTAQAILDAANSPDNISPTAVIADVAATPGLSPSQRLAATVQAESAATGPLAGIVTPSVTVDPLVQAQADSDARTRERAIAALPQTSLIQTAERYAGDAVGGLIEDLGLGADGEDPRTYVFGLFGEDPDSNQLRLHIKDIAQRAGVTEEMAAAGMADQFRRDPWGVNRNDKRFNPDEVVTYLQETASPEAMRAYEGALVDNDTRAGRNEAAQLELTALQAQLAKATDPARREQLQRQVNQARDQVISGASPQEAQEMLSNYIRQNGTASRLRGLDPESLEYAKAIEDLRTEIERDPELGDREKSLLISTLTG